MAQRENTRRKLIELDSRRGGISIDGFRKVYREARTDLSPKTLAADDLALRLLSEVVGNKSLAGVSGRDLERFKSVCLARGVLPVSVHTYMRHIKAALNYARRNNYIENLPVFPKIKIPRRLPHAIEPEVLDSILAWARENDYELWRIATFALWTGCRRSEVLGLTYERVELYDDNNPSATAGVCGRAKIVGKGDRERIVYLLRPAVEAIKPVRDIGRVFVAWHPATITHRWKAAVRAAGHETPRFHDLRHTAGVRMVAAGVHIRVIQKVLGHADIATTMLYTEVFNSIAEKEMGKML